MALKRGRFFSVLLIGLPLKIQHPQNLLQLDRILQIRFRTVPVNPHHFIKSDSCKTAVQHNPIKLVQIRELPVPLFLLLSTPCPIPPVSLVVLFTSIHIHYFLALAFFTPALRLCSSLFPQNASSHTLMCVVVAPKVHKI